MHDKSFAELVNQAGLQIFFPHFAISTVLCNVQVLAPHLLALVHAVVQGSPIFCLSPSVFFVLLCFPSSTIYWRGMGHTIPQTNAGGWGQGIGWSPFKLSPVPCSATSCSAGQEHTCFSFQCLVLVNRGTPVRRGGGQTGSPGRRKLHRCSCSQLSLAPYVVLACGCCPTMTQVRGQPHQLWGCPCAWVIWGQQQQW